MTLDFQQVRKQVLDWGLKAPERARRLTQLREKASELLGEYAQETDRLRNKVSYVAQHFDANIRCALPTDEALNTCIPLPEPHAPVTLLAADGSQINPDRNAPVDYCLVNVGGFMMRQGFPDPPVTSVRSQLFSDEQLETPTGLMDEETVALTRDLAERRLLAELAQQALPPVIALTDGPIELWGAKNRGSEGAIEFQKSLQAYLEILRDLCDLEVTVAGYVDKPGANLLVRLLEIAILSEPELAEISKLHPLRGVRDIDLLARCLKPGERSAVFGMQSKSAEHYQEELGLHFFYLNVGRAGNPWLARVEIPAWVARQPEKLSLLQAALFSQSQIMGNRPYPYLLHRAHEAALVTLAEKEQVTQMIVNELLHQGVPIDGESHKQSAKGLAGRTRYGI